MTDDKKRPPDEATPAVAFFMGERSVYPESRSELVRDLVGRLDEALRDLYEERAGILEYDAGDSRELAECLALLNIYRDHPLEVLGVKVYRRGEGEFVLVSRMERGRRPEGWIGAEMAGFREGLVDEVIASLGGVALVTAFDSK